jgi:hypothetical protein
MSDINERIDGLKKSGFPLLRRTLPGLVLAFLCPALTLFAEIKSCGYVTDAQKKKYQDISLEALQLDPGKKYKKGDFKVTIRYSGESNYVPYLYSQEMPQKKFFYFNTFSGTGGFSNRFSILFSRSSRKKILEALSEVGKNEQIALYGSVKKLTSKKKNDYGDNASEYYFQVEDMESGLSDDIGNKPKDFDPKNYDVVEGKSLDLVAPKVEGEKICFDSKYLGREEQIDYRLQSMFSSDQFFQLQIASFSGPEKNTDNAKDEIERRAKSRNIHIIHVNSSSGPEKFRGLPIICSKTNSSVTDRIIDLPRESPIRIFGTVTKFERQSGSNIYYSGESGNFHYFVVDTIEPGNGDTTDPAEASDKMKLPKNPEPLRKTNP